MKTKIEISTVDGFQGREKEAIVISMVRSNEERIAGSFVTDVRRINVGLTRAKSALILVCDVDTLGFGTSPWRNYLRWAEDGGLVLGASFYLDERAALRSE